MFLKSRNYLQGYYKMCSENKDKLIQIRVTEEKYNELCKWANKFGIKLGPWCLFILMEKLNSLENYGLLMQMADNNRDSEEQ